MLKTNISCYFELWLVLYECLVCITTKLYIRFQKECRWLTIILKLPLKKIIMQITGLLPQAELLSYHWQPHWYITMVGTNNCLLYSMQYICYICVNGTAPSQIFDGIKLWIELIRHPWLINAILVLPLLYYHHSCIVAGIKSCCR